MTISARRFFDAFAIGLPYVTISRYAIELIWPIALWAIVLQVRLPAKRRARVASLTAEQP